MVDKTLRSGMLVLAVVCSLFACMAMLVAGTIAPPQQSQTAVLNPPLVVGAAMAMADERKQGKPCQQLQEKSQEPRKAATQTQRPSLKIDPLKILLRGILL